MIDELLPTLGKHIREQATAHDTGLTGGTELVAARVSRAVGFANVGLTASGHRLVVDEPEAFGGTGAAADPAELLLVAVGASLSVTLTVHAALSDIEIDGVDVALAGSLDAGRFFHPEASPGGGFENFSVEVTLSTRATRPAAQALLDRALLASPVLRSIAATPTVTLHLKES